MRAGISANAKTDPSFIEGNLNCQCYINEVLTRHLLPFLRWMLVSLSSRMTTLGPIEHVHVLLMMVWPVMSAYL